MTFFLYNSTASVKILVWLFFFFKLIIVHFTGTGVNEAGVDLVFIQPFLRYYVSHVFLKQTGIFKHNFHKKRTEVCIKTRSTEPEPHFHSKARILSSQLWNGLFAFLGFKLIAFSNGTLFYFSYYIWSQCIVLLYARSIHASKNSGGKFLSRNTRFCRMSVALLAFEMWNVQWEWWSGSTIIAMLLIL